MLLFLPRGPSFLFVWFCYRFLQQKVCYLCVLLTFLPYFLWHLWWLPYMDKLWLIWTTRVIVLLNQTLLLITNYQLFVACVQVNPSWVGPNTTLLVKNLNDFPLYTSERELTFRLMPRMIGSDGRVLVKCAAEIPGAYWESNEVQLVVDQPQRASIMEGRSSSGRCSLGSNSGEARRQMRAAHRKVRAAHRTAGSAYQKV